MSSFMNQTIAREHVSEMIALAQASQIRRQLRAARRAERVTRRLARRTSGGPSNVSLYAPDRVGLAGVR
jgi:hypothetical protein